LLIRIALVLPLVGDRDEALYARRCGSGKWVKVSGGPLNGQRTYRLKWTTFSEERGTYALRQAEAGRKYYPLTAR